MSLDAMDDDESDLLSLPAACRDLGSALCLTCDLGVDIPDCRFHCGHCRYWLTCPCSYCGWLNRHLGK